MKQQNPNRYLVKRYNKWYLHWNVPQDLREHHFFAGRAVYQKTLQTTDLHEARRMRDLLVAEFERLLAECREAPRRHKFNSILEEVRQAKAELDRQLPFMSNEDALDAVDALEAAFSAEHAFERQDEAALDAILVGLHGHTELKDKYALSVSEAAKRYVKENEELGSTTISRVKTATASLLSHARNKGLKLQSVDRRQVTLWINSLASEFSDSSRKGYMAALVKMWEWYWLRGEVEGDNPFKSVRLKMSDDGTSYAPFTTEQVRLLVARSPMPEFFLIKYGLITGCRLGELVALEPDDMLVDGGIHCLRVKKGKTRSATRKIPLPLDLWTELRQLLEEDVWATKGRTPSVNKWSLRFAKLKRAIPGTDSKVHTFHSFRHMTATAYDRCHTAERHVSYILGHKHKKAESESYGTYTAGLSLSQYLEAVETMLASDYMQQFLKLFNK